MKSLDTIRSKRESVKSQAEAQANIDALVKKLAIALKTPIAKEEYGPFIAKIAQIGKEIAKTLEEYRNDTKNADKLAEIAEELQKLSIYNVKSNREQGEEIKAVFEEIKKSLKSFKIDLPEADFSPIKEAIESLKLEKGISLEDYRAHDILNSGDKQYIGFQNPAGNWYIMENDTKNNKLRYVFGRGGYSQAFKKAGSYEYELLSEAINALSA